MASESIALVYRLPPYPQSNNLLVSQLQSIVRSNRHIREIYLLDGKALASSFPEALLGKLREIPEVKMIEADALGEGLHEAAHATSSDYLLTFTNHEDGNPEAAIDFLNSVEKTQAGLPKSNEIITGHGKKGRNDQRHGRLNWYQSLTTLRTKAPANPLKLYPITLARYLFDKTPVHSPCFELECFHRAEMEGVRFDEHLEENQDFDTTPAWTRWQTLKRAVAFKWHYQVAEPLQVALQNDQISKPTSLLSPQYYARLAFTVLLAVLFLLMPVLSLDHGATWDEYFTEISAEKLADFYLTLGEDKSALDYRNRKYYGGLFDTFSGFAVKLFNPMFGQDFTFEIRHMFNALIGFLGILFTALLGKYLGRWRGGLLALLFIALSPRFLGHAMNNPKDIPFAAAFIMGVYFIIKTVREFPYPTKRAVFWLVFAIACAISIRVGGLLLICYFGLFIIIYVLHEILSKNNLPSAKWWFIKRGVGICLIVLVLGYFGGLVFWPYALIKPFLNPFLALAEMSDFSNAVTTWFEGEVMKSDKLPWYYIFKYLAITSPLFVVAGFAIGAGWGLWKAPRQFKNAYLMLLFTALFPIGFIIVKGSNVYDGIRQLLFIYPSLVVFTSSSWLQLFNGLEKRLIKVIGITGLAVLLILPLAFTIRNHPHEYVYFNELIGGVPGAYGKYELDYWGNSSREAFKFLGPYLQKHHHKDSTIRLNTNFLEPNKDFLRQYHPHIDYNKTKLERMDSTGWDYGFFIARWFPLEYFNNGQWPPENTIHQIKVDEVPIAAVVKNPNTEIGEGGENKDRE